MIEDKIIFERKSFLPNAVGARKIYIARLASRQDGAFGILFVPLLIVLIAFSALALDIGQLYNRKVDLNGLAKAVALAAAHELNGTSAGIDAARTQAQATAARLKYRYFGDGSSFTWNDNALSFSSTPARSGTWIPAASANGTAANLYFAKVDTAQLGDASGTVQTFFIQILSAGLRQIPMSDSVVAGRAGIGVTPIAICAMGDAAVGRDATTSSGGTVTELVQYGFRRGVSYDLMQLNPAGNTPVSYAVNPVSAPGMPSTAFDTGILGPFICAGNMWMSHVTGGRIHVTQLDKTVPLKSLYTPLNARFDIFSGTSCDPSGGPPDFNIKSYAYDQAGVVKWMSPTSGNAAAASTTSRNKLETVADLPAPPASAGAYGPLWTYAKAVKAPSPITAAEPSAGYATFSSTDWPTIYKSGPSASSYPASPPYQSSSASSGYYQAPRAANLEISSLQRRVLNLPLLDCTSAPPTGSNVEANVLAVGKFFMTVPATDSTLIAEFAGVLPEQSMASQVELYP